MIRAALAATLMVLPLAAAGQDTPPDPLGQILSQRTAECAAFENGELGLEDGAFARTDLDGDGQLDWVLDETYLRCSSAASLFCGTGGCTVNFLVGDTLTSRLTKGWQLADFGPFRILLLQLHGAHCRGINPTPCVEALVWDRDAAHFTTVAPPTPEPSTPIPAPAD